MRNYRSLLAFGGLAILAVLTTLRASSWSDPVTLATVEAENHPNSSRSVYAAARVNYGLYLMRGDKEAYSRAVGLLEKAGDLDPKAKLPYIALIRLSYGRGEAPTTAWQNQLVERFEHQRISLSDTFGLAAFIKCHAESKDCPIPLEYIAKVYYAALQNQLLVLSVKAQLLVDFGVLNVNHYGDVDVAINAFDEAVQLRPNQFSYRLIRAQILLAGERFDRVADEIVYFRSRPSGWDDELHTPYEKVDSLEFRLRERQAEPENLEPDQASG